MFDTKTPSTLEIIEDARLKARLAELGRRQQETAEGLKQQRPTDEQMEAERRQAESNALAEANPLYSAARATSANFLVVPLAPGGTEPLVPLSKATNDARQLYEWWSSEEFKDCNPGILLGRVGGVLALQVDDDDALLRLRQMARVDHPEYEDGRDSVRAYVEYREIGGDKVRLVRPSQPVSVRSLSGWGKDVKEALIKRERELWANRPQALWLVWSYPAVQSGMDAHDFRSRKVGPGLTVLGEGDVLPWEGSVIEGPRGELLKVVSPMNRPPEVPLWLGKMLGRPRSRRAMAAARESYEALIRRDNAHVIARIAATRAFEDEARAKAEEDRARAERILAEAMAKGDEA
jgi:hypothetical protein